MGQIKVPRMPLGIRHVGTPSAATGKININFVFSLSSTTLFLCLLIFFMASCCSSGFPKLQLLHEEDVLYGFFTS
jgi:hypothetical protein